MWPGSMTFAHLHWTLLLSMILWTTDAMADPQPATIDQHWNVQDPAASEARFRELLRDYDGDPASSYAIEVMSQIARAQGMQHQFTAAHATLDAAAALLTDDMPIARVRVLLERGRAFNSSGDPAASIPYFEQALSMADGLSEFYAVDAAHMLGIVHEGDAAIAWNERAMKMAEAASDPRARRWLGPLYNNLAWTYHELGRYKDALALFERDVRYRTDLDRPIEASIARWSMANTLRHLGRVEEALSIQMDLLTHPDRQNNTREGYTREEIGECLLALGRADEATPHFARAWELLKDDPWLARDESDRLARLRTLGGVQNE
jgi:tetratricopeptide (TPR) repeat protein